MDAQTKAKKESVRIVEDAIAPKRSVPDTCDVCGVRLPRVGYGEDKGWPKVKGNVQLIEHNIQHYQWYLCAGCARQLNRYLLDTAMKTQKGSQDED
mgnify:CR=1 FL=1